MPGSPGAPRKAAAASKAERELQVSARNETIQKLREELEAIKTGTINEIKALEAPNFLLKIIPHVDCSPRICELVRYYTTDIALKGAWEGPAGLELHHHALAPVAALPVLEVISAVHLLTDLTLGLGEVMHDYLE